MEMVQLNSLWKEVNSLIEYFTTFKIIGVGRITPSNDKSHQSSNVIILMLNSADTLLCYEFYGNLYELECDGKVLHNNTYDDVRSELQNKRYIFEEKTNEILIQAKQEILSYLTENKKIVNHDGFFTEFRQFVDIIPEISADLAHCIAEMKAIVEKNDDSEENIHEIMKLKTKLVVTSTESLFEGATVNENKMQVKNQEKEFEEKNAFPFAKKYPEQAAKMKTIFEILDILGNHTQDPVIERKTEKVFRLFGLSEIAIQKLKTYMISRKTSDNKTEVEVSGGAWYTDDEINTYGKVLEQFNVNLERQFSNMLTADCITTLPQIESLQDDIPRYICFNVGGNVTINNSGMHWIVIVLVKKDEKVYLLYKDLMGDFENSSDEIEKSFEDHYGDKLKFIKNNAIEQRDGTNCGPMTINNLKLIAEMIHDYNNKGFDGIEKLIEEFETMTFTSQSQLEEIRFSHLMLRVPQYKPKDIDYSYAGYSSLETIVDQLCLSSLIENQKEIIKQDVIALDEHYNDFKDLGVLELKCWSQVMNGKLDRNFNDSESKNRLLKTIAMMDRANEIATGGHRFLPAQKRAILMFMQSDSHGHISQINTGEGKTTIVSVLAALRVMQGFKVHVITSNNVLASDGVEKKNLFYQLLSISASDNNPEGSYVDGTRKCYDSDVVYGSITNFQSDWLRHSFEQLKTMGETDFSNIWVMLDEIDSLLIDQGSNIAKLSGPFPGMESLRYVYINIWVALAKAEEKIYEEMSTKITRKKEELREIPESERNDGMKQLDIDDFKNQLAESFLTDVKNEIISQKDFLINKEIIASHLHDFADDNIERWIELAFAAKYCYHENVEYKIGMDEQNEKIITPVDNQNTGVSMKNTVLSNGLHQFLQLKHNLCLTYETLTSCYISNLDYIRKYGNKLAGVTGTLGSELEQKLLGKAFDLTFSIVPPSKEKQFVLFPGMVFVDEHFANDVAQAALVELMRTKEKVLHPRAVLIICRSILDVEMIMNELELESKAAGIDCRLNKYVDESHVGVTHKTLQVGDIVVATNLAGRGTDFSTSKELEENGGLHVIEAFAPCNKRVEDQGMGRTCRRGNKGTGQIFVRLSEVEALTNETGENIEDFNFDEVMRLRDFLEETRVNDIAENKIKELEFKGLLFDQFSEWYSRLKKEHKAGEGHDVVKWMYVLRDLKEKWAFWLQKENYTADKIKTLLSVDSCAGAAKKEYAKFVEEAKEISEGNINHNPFHSICLAEKYLEDCTSKSMRQKAKDELNHAITLSGDGNLLYSAHIKLFEISIDNGEQFLKRFKKALANFFFCSYDENENNAYKSDALSSLEKAHNALKLEYNYLEKLITGEDCDESKKEGVGRILIQNKIGDEKNIFVKHLSSRLTCLAVFKGNVESLIRQLKGVEGFDENGDKIDMNADGIIIASKVPRYLATLDSCNPIKDKITEASVDEFEYVGMNSVYQLRKVYDIPQTVLTGAKVQIGVAVTLFASAAAFPFLMPVNGPLAGAMLTEAISDILTELLINQGQKKFDKKDYIEDKVISYGTAILTIGAGALWSEVLETAKNVFLELADKLLANQLDKVRYIWYNKL